MQVLKPWGEAQGLAAKKQERLFRMLYFKEQDGICHGEQGLRCPRRRVHPTWMLPREWMVATHMHTKKCHPGARDRHQHEGSGSRRDV